MTKRVKDEELENVAGGDHDLLRYREYLDRSATFREDLPEADDAAMQNDEGLGEIQND